MEMSETSQVVYIAGERVETIGVTKISKPSQVVYIGGKKSGPDQDSTNHNGHPDTLENRQSRSSTDEDIVENLDNVNHDAPESSQAIYRSGNIIKEVEEFTNEMMGPEISEKVEDANHVADPIYAEQSIPQEENTQAIEIKSKEQDHGKENISLHNFIVADVPVETIEQISEENNGKHIAAEMSNESLGKAQSPSIPDETNTSDMKKFIHDASDPFQVYIAGKITEKMEILKNEAVEPTISDRVEDIKHVSVPGCEKQKIQQTIEETNAIGIKSKEQDSSEDIQSLKNIQVMDVSGDTSELSSGQNIKNPIISDISKIMTEREDNGAETPKFTTKIQITPEEQVVAEYNLENVPLPQNTSPVTPKSVYIKPKEPEPENEIMEILKPTTATNDPQERSTLSMDIKNGHKDTSEKIEPESIAVRKFESDTLSEKSDSTVSIYSSVEDGQNVSKSGVANAAFVNVDDDVLKEIEKKNKRTLLQSIENNEKSLAADDGKVLNPDLDKKSPPIMADDSKNAKIKKEYSEYFIPETENTKSFRGETEPLYETKSKDQGNTNLGKFCCWLFVIALLAGAITVGVLIGIGVINLEPLLQIKESRNLDTEPTNKGTAKLFEVKDADAPNVLTNDPYFFSPKNNSSQGQDSEPRNISKTDVNNNTSKDTQPDNSTDTFTQKVNSEADKLLPVKVTATETETSIEPEGIFEVTTYLPVEISSNADSDSVEVSTGSMSILEKETTSESQEVIVEATEENIKVTDLRNISEADRPNKLPSEEAFELLKAEGDTVQENRSDATTVNNQTNIEEKISFPESDLNNPSLSDIVTEKFITTTKITSEDNFTDVIDIRFSEPRELVLPEV